MADTTLNATTPLGGYSKDFGNVVLAEVTGRGLVSIAIPVGKEKSITADLKKAFKADLPKIGSSTNSGNSTAVFWGMQIDQLFVLLDHDGDDAARYVEQKLGDAGYYTDQSDSWVILNISGAGARPALERICMLDLNQNAFPGGSVARTVMEHLGTIVYFAGADSFFILAARSSAKSLLHALEVSIQNTDR